ncbi:MAG TPA: triose-phosphate isomerase family protein [Dermatophilaceae bacterium]|jgi:triosephosphate isomerase
MSDLPPLIAVSLKMYLGVAATRAWVAQVADVGACLETDANIELAVLPTFPLLESTAKTLAGTGICWGAQDVAASLDGAQTGEVSVEVLAELGCRYVEIGHVERRRLFGEDDDMVQAKVSQVVGAGLVPLYCLGEAERGVPSDAAHACLVQLQKLLDVAAGSEVVVAYEPTWAIGASVPAPAEYVADVCSHLRSRLNSYAGPSRLLYGGSAGPGTYQSLRPAVDGLFLGRFAHDTRALAQVVTEVITSGQSRIATFTSSKEQT